MSTALQAQWDAERRARWTDYQVNEIADHARRCDEVASYAQWLADDVCGNDDYTDEIAALESTARSHLNAAMGDLTMLTQDGTDAGLRDATKLIPEIVHSFLRAQRVTKWHRDSVDRMNGRVVSRVSERRDNDGNRAELAALVSDLLTPGGK